MIFYTHLMDANSIRIQPIIIYQPIVNHVIKINFIYIYLFSINPNSPLLNVPHLPFQKSTPEAHPIINMPLMGRDALSMAETPIAGDRTLVFTYGTLKRGFSNHKLLEALIQSNHASFVGPAATSSPVALVCGPYRVPFILNLPNSRSSEIYPVSGEVYSVSPIGLARLDELEGVSRGHYERLPLKVRVIKREENEEDGTEVEAQGYFGHKNYAMEMWRRNGERGLREYTKEVATGYVRRMDRPQGLTFLDHIRFFVESKG
jgi:gamma-glutamylaminecyclotransferase